MFKVKTDIEKNRLYVTLSGLFPVTDAKKAKDLIIKEVEALKPGFDLITDITRFIRGEDEGGAVLQEIMLYLIEKKVNRVVRVVGTSKTGLLQFANYSQQISSYKLKYLPTLEEAENFLDQKEPE
jgi:hypothetical protein